MDNGYAVEEREQQIAVLRELKKQRRREMHGLPPKTLLESMREEAPFSATELKTLVEKEYQNPVVSFYMRLSASSVAPRETASVRLFRSLKSRVIERRKDFIDTLLQPQKELLNYDLREIELFLEKYFVPHNVHSVIIFKSGEHLNRVIALPVRSADDLVIDPDPYILPLEAILEENERVLLIEITKDESRFTVYQLGYCQEEDRISSFVPTDRIEASIPGHVQRHRLTHLQWHLKATAQRAYHLFGEMSCRLLVLMAEERVCHMFESFLHESLRERIIHRLNGSPAADPRNRNDLIETALHAHKAAHEVHSLDELREHKPAQEVVSSLANVVKACNLFLIRKLVLNQSLHKKAFVCKQHHYLSLEGAKCPFCNSPLLSVENIADEIIEIARLHGVQITLVEHRQDLMARYEGIAALLYAPLGEV
jgi:hypothetical protein